jgi:hypothetical protein
VNDIGLLDASRRFPTAVLAIRETTVAAAHFMDGRHSDPIVEPTEKQNLEALVDQIDRLIHRLLIECGPVCAVGIAVPVAVTTEGAVSPAPAVALLHDVALGERLPSWQVLIVVETDATCIAFGGRFDDQLQPVTAGAVPDVAGELTPSDLSAHTALRGVALLTLDAVLAACAE